jgi:hypothetical protein
MLPGDRQQLQRVGAPADRGRLGALHQAGSKSGGLDAHVILRRHGKVLLPRRVGTVYASGQLCVPSGHLEGGENILQAAVLETRAPARRRRAGWVPERPVEARRASRRDRVPARVSHDRYLGPVHPL